MHEYCSFPTYFYLWKPNFPDLKVSQPVDNICKDCYAFANHHRYLKNHTMGCDDDDGNGDRDGNGGGSGNGDSNCDSDSDGDGDDNGNGNHDGDGKGDGNSNSKGKCSTDRCSNDGNNNDDNNNLSDVGVCPMRNIDLTIRRRCQQRRIRRGR
jgi:hypothetical protein